MRNVLWFLCGFVCVLAIAVVPELHAQETPFDPLTWAASPEGKDQIAGYFGAGLFFPLMGYAVGFGAGQLLRLIGGDRS